jgi:hypothetical protein
MQGIYNYIPEINHVSMANSVVAIQQLQVIAHTCNVTPNVEMFCTFTLVIIIITIIV